MDGTLLIWVCAGIGAVLLAVQAGWLLIHNLNVVPFNTVVARLCNEGRREVVARLCAAAAKSPYSKVVLAMVEEAQRCIAGDPVTHVKTRIRGVLDDVRRTQLARVRSLRWHAPFALVLGVVVALLGLTEEPLEPAVLIVAGTLVVIAIATWQWRIRLERSFAAADELVEVFANTVR